MRKRGFPLHVYLSTLFLVTALSIGGLIAFIGFRLSQQLLENSASELSLRSASEVESALAATLAPVDLLLKLTAQGPLEQAGSLAERRQLLRPLQAGLDATPQLAAIYLGYPNGDFLLLRRLASAAQRLYYDAPENALYLLQSIERASDQGHYLYLDAQLQVLRDDHRADYPGRYDPRQRPWYREAKAHSDAVLTDAYVFFSDQQIGITLASQTDTGGVLAADITLDSLGQTLARQAITPSTQLALVDGRQQVIAHAAGEQNLTRAEGDPRHLLHLEELQPAVLSQAAGHPAGATPPSESADGAWRLLSHPLRLPGAKPMQLMLAIPYHELFAAALQLRDRALSIILVILALAIPLIWLLSRAISSSLRQLAQSAEAVRRFEFDTDPSVRSRIVEVVELANSMQLAREAIRRFISVLQAASEERDFDRLLAILLRETRDAARSSAGILYLHEDGELRPMIALDANEHEISREARNLHIEHLVPEIRDALQSGQNCTVARSQLGALGLQDQALLESSQCILVPLCNRQRALLGAILLGREQPMDAAEQAFIGALGASASSSLETRELIKAQKDLFQAFVHLIADAIDAKSPYTGGHCKRVPELTRMLAQAACEQRQGPYADFQLDDEQWEAVHVAAWLHDCGKITTPEYVVDKATKLETLHNRIHEVRTRVEVLKRDARIRELEARLAGEPADSARAQRDAEWQSLDEDFAFLAQCNQGGEFLGEDDLARLQRIAGRRWQRTLDDRLGLSWEELQRYPETAAALPAEETLLSDRPEHCIPYAAGHPPAASHGDFHMPPLPLRQNRGELHCLQVARGTLNAEERYIINEHIVQTLVMLRQLPFPRHLRQVPELAGGHHEKMDGSGYPMGLKQEQMSPVARMMAIADIFEALTAVDRPYKRGKTLSESLAIMRSMAEEQHIDAELFALFIDSDIPRRYAEQHLQAEQLDLA